jgi:hypothetical protein
VAIKSKGRTKTRQVARPPRREPVAVKPAFFLRRRVQLVGAALAGAAVVLIAVWVTNGLRHDRNQTKARQVAATKLGAATKWKSAVEGTVATVGTLGTGSAAPTVLPQLDAAITALQKGTVPKGADKQLKTAAANATGAASGLTKFDLAGTITQKGFSAGEAFEFTTSRDALSSAFRLYARAATIAGDAAKARGAERVALAKAAAGIRDEASVGLQSGWSLYQQALFSGGIPVTAPAPVGGNSGNLPGAIPTP